MRNSENIEGHMRLVISARGPIPEIQYLQKIRK